MYCQNCGAENPEVATFCSKCGTTIKNVSNQTVSANYSTQVSNTNDTKGIGWFILCFLFPIVGFVLFFVWKNNNPNRASWVLTAAGVGFGVGLIMILSS
jgi:uncharacterized membrane protein YvbJ